MKRYKVLWLEDEINKVEAFFDMAEMENIELDHVETVNEMKSKLIGKKIVTYDAAILDAKGVIESLEEIPSLRAVQEAIEYINGLNNVKVLPKFILSAQLGGDENGNIREMLGEENIYIKTRDEEKLLSNLKVEADKQIETQIRHENYMLFKVLDEYEEEVGKTFMQVLLGIKNGINGFDDELYFTHLRIILEHVFRKANNIGILHDNCVQRGGSRVNLTDASLFLAGEDTLHSRVRCRISHFPKIIAENIKNIIFITGAASHTTEVDITKNIDVLEYRKTVQSPNLLFSLGFQMIDVLLWFDKYSQQNSNVDVNKSYWQEIEYTVNDEKLEIGKVIRIAPNGWGTVASTVGTVSIYKGNVTQLNLKEGDQIKFTTNTSPKADNIEKI